MRILKVKDWLSLQKEKEKLAVYESKVSIAKRWVTSGLLNELKGYMKSNIAQLLESQASSMLNELSTEPLSDTFKTTKQP